MLQSVSYTHLDVYKRQGEDRGLQRTRHHLLPVQRTETDGEGRWTGSVSYTHLDVYKRQLTDGTELGVTRGYRKELTKKHIAFVQGGM